MILRSPFPPIDIPEISLPRFVLDAAAGRAEQPALIDGITGRVTTYGALVQDVRRMAAGLAQRGFRKGDVFAILCPNCPEYAVALHAVWRLGGIVTTINGTYTVEEIAFQLKDANATYLLTIPALLERAVEAGAGRIRKFFVLDEAEDLSRTICPDGQMGESATSFDTLLASEAEDLSLTICPSGQMGEPPEVAIDPRRDLAALPYSSGTTGLPKGVMLTHYNLVANILQIEAGHAVLPGDRMIGILPFFHIYGLVVVLNTSLHLGATVVTMPRFDLEGFLRILQDHGITRACLVPPIVVALAKHPLVDQYDLSTLRSIFSGAAPLGEDVAATCAARLDCVVKQGYGMTEASPVTHLTPDWPGPVKRGSIGFTVALTESRIVDPQTGADLGPNQQGELWVRGPQVMLGYLNRPDATAQILDADGWLHSGDIAYVDDDGFFYIVDRLKELIKYKGLQIAPAELEAVLLTHPAIADAAVIPSPDEEAGEVPKAFVVLKGEATEAEILAFVASKVAPYKKIRKLEFIGQIPKSASGKILRRVLVDQERKAPAQP